MVTSVPKSYQATIKHPAPPTKQGQAGPATPTFPHTFSEKLFQVPAGKTWQVLKLIIRNPPPQDPAEFLRIEKANSGGTEQIVLMEFGFFSDGKITAWSPYDVTEYFQNVVLEDQEIIRQVVRLPTAGTKLTMEYELSVIEFTL